MSAYEYIALNDNGVKTKGILEGDSPRHIRQKLREEALTALSVVEVTGKAHERPKAALFNQKISASHLALITRQLSTLIQSSLPVETALQTVAKHSPSPRHKRLLLGVRARVLEGHSLAVGLADYPHIFPIIYRSTIEAGEHSGHLSVVLERLADFTENRQKFRQKMLLASIYPLLMASVAVLVVIALLSFVVPKVIAVFDTMQQELPPLTNGLIAVSEFINTHGVILLAGLLAAVMVSKAAFRYRVVKKWFGGFIVKQPGLSRLALGVNTAQFCRTFSILMSSGVPIIEAMKISAQVVENLHVHDAILDATAKVREGGGLTLALEATRCFTPMTLSLIGSGEASGQLAQMLDRAAKSQESETDALVSTLLALFEPLLILFMGGIVLLIVLAIMLPIFNLNQLVH